MLSSERDRTVFQSLHIPWLPGVDGVFITDAPFNLVKNGIVSPVPYVNGVRFLSNTSYAPELTVPQDNDDEGTLFALSLTDIMSVFSLDSNIRS